MKKLASALQVVGLVAVLAGAAMISVGLAVAVAGVGALTAGLILEGRGS